MSALIVNHVISAIDAARTAAMVRNRNYGGLSMKVLPNPKNPGIRLNYERRF